MESLDDALKETGNLAVNGVVAYLTVKHPHLAGMTTSLSLAYGLIGAGITLRKDRFKEMVEYINNNASLFTPAILEDPHFQDGFLYIIEKYIRERNENKRKMIKNVFFGYTKTKNKEEFPFERYCYTTEQLSIEDIKVLEVLYTREKSQESTKQALTEQETYDKMVFQEEYRQIFGNKQDYLDNIKHLVNLGILLEDSSSRRSSQQAPYVKLSLFGRCYINYLEY